MKKGAVIGFVTLTSLISLTGAACNRRVAEQNSYPNRIPTTQTPEAPATNAPGSGPESPTAGQKFDCTAANCPRLVINGDPESTLPNGQPAPFRGYADPSIRKDPDSNRLWLAYSWPHVTVDNGQRMQGVESHLAYSDNEGKTWQFDKVLWPETPTTNKGGNNEPGLMAHEVPNLLPVKTSNGTVWYGVREDYFLPTGGYKSRPATSFQLRVFRASSPEALSDAPSVVLGSMATAPGWNANVNLASLSPSLNRCEIWNEAALYYENDSLYLSTRCLAFNGKTPDAAASDLVVFSTTAQGNPADWQWRYVGVLAGNAVAKELGASGVTQIELAKSGGGQLLAIITPDDYSAQYNDFVHHGCVAVEMSSINPPVLARDANGKLKVLATITASDEGPVGSAACTYDPSSKTGIIMTRRTKNSSEFTTSLNQTFIRP